MRSLNIIIYQNSRIRIINYKTKYPTTKTIVLIIYKYPLSIQIIRKKMNRETMYERFHSRSATFGHTVISSYLNLEIYKVTVRLTPNWD